MLFPTWRQWLKRLALRVRDTGCSRKPQFGKTGRSLATIVLHAERLEDRLAPSDSGTARPLDIRTQLAPDLDPALGPLMFRGAYAPAGIQKAYGIDQLIANRNDGTGQTIAVIEAYDNPAFSSSATPAFATSDLHYFDQQFGLPDPVFVKVAQDGSANYPGQDPSFPPNDWEGEAALDVEWAHAVAPGAKILLVECAVNNNDSLFAGATWAATPVSKGGGGATVVAMSFGTSGGDPSATTLDANFAPSAFPGVTFLAAVGDNGSVRNQGDYPADSPYVVAVGGTSLTVNSSGVYASETVWRSSRGGVTGGGTSRYESQPIYQKLAEPNLSRRATPDVAFDADPNTGLAVYDSYNGGAVLGSSANISGVGGTSAAVPCWAGLVAIANQIRANQAIPEPPLTGATQTLPILYNIYSSPTYHQAFHDITTGGNGAYNAASGYDEVSGIGTPIANVLVPALANVNQLIYTAPSGNNNFLLQASATDLQLYDNGVLVATNPLAQTTSALITGAKDNSLTVDSTGLPPTLAVTFDGGPNALAHTLTIKNGSFASETYTYAGAGAGTIGLDGLSISYSHVTSTANLTTGSNLVFNLPAGARATLQANSAPANTIAGSGFVPSAFGNSFAGLTIATSGGSLVQIAPPDPGFSPAAYTFSGVAGDVFLLQARTAITAATAVTLSTATLDLGGISPVIGTLTGSGVITNSAATPATLTVGADGGSGTFSGVVNDGATSVTLVKTGKGTQTLAGASTYSGTTTVAAGALQVDGSVSSSVTVQSGATLVGAGGTGPVTAQNGGALYAAASVSALSSSSLSFASGSTFNVAIPGAMNYSQSKVVLGSVTLGGANLVLSGPLTPVLGQFFTIISNTGNLAVNGTFNGLPEGAVITNFLGSGLNATITYMGGDGNDVVLIVGQGALTTSSVTASVASTTYGQPVTFTATVTGASDTPVGKVEFYDKTTGADLGPGTLVGSGGGKATWVLQTLSTQLQATGANADDIRVLFTSTANFLPSAATLAGGLKVAPVTLTISGLTANNKVYDGTTNAILNASGVTLIGLLNGDQVSLDTSGASASFATGNVGNGIPVTFSGLAFAGPQARDYALTSPPLVTANITAAPLTVAGITVNNKTYDGTTAAMLSTGNAALAGVLSGDSVALSTSTATGTFASKDVGTGIAVAVSGLTLTGAQAGDYTLTPPAMTASIMPAPLTVTGTQADKVYDTTTRAPLNMANVALVGVVPGDQVTLNATGASAAFASKDAGTNIAVSVSGLTLGGAQASDYALTPLNLTANIAPAPLTVTGIAARDKVYDGSTAAALDTTNAVLVGAFRVDTLQVSATAATGTFVSKDVGTNIPVTIAGLAVSGPNASDYLVTQPAATASIMPRPLTVTGVTAQDKVYDATTAVTIDPSAAALVNVVGGDSVALDASAAVATFARKDVGDDVPVAVTGMTIWGPQAPDYTLIQPTTTANITPASLTVTGITADKVYDATTRATPDASQATLLGVLDGDLVTLLTGALAGRFTNKEVGNNINVILTGLSLGGPQANDYMLKVPVTTRANITPAPLTVTGITADKVYDGTTTATLSTANATLVGAMPGDFLTLVTVLASGTFATRDAGKNVTVTVSGLGIEGQRTRDYLLTQPVLTATITPAPLTVTGITANDKLYDGTTAASLNVSGAALAGPIYSADSVTLATSGAAGTFASKDVGNNILVTASGLALIGPQAADYALVQPTTTANITRNSLPAAYFTISAPANAAVGSPVSITVTARDKYNNAVGNGYSGTIHFVSTDPLASLPADTALVNGTGSFTVTLNTAGTQSITATDTVSRGITGTSNLIAARALPARLAVSGPATATAGTPFPVVVTALDANGQTAIAYTGAIQLASTDGQAVLPTNANLTNGTGTFLVTLKTAGNSWSVSASDVLHPSITGVSGPVTVNPAAASYFTVVVPSGTVTTGSPFNVTVTARDALGNVATSYSGHVHFTSSDANAQLPADSLLSGGVGLFRVTLSTAGSQTIMATDVVVTSPALTGTSSPIRARGLLVTSLAPTPTGFTATFSKPFLPEDLALYASGLATAPSVTLVGAHAGPITGSLLWDPSSMNVTFKATTSFLLLMSNFASAVLPDDTYTVTLVKGSTRNGKLTPGFVDALGAGLDGLGNGTQGNFVSAPFTTHYQANNVPDLAIPDFARGPDSAHTVKAPNDSASGIPITLYGASGVSDVTFTLHYDPALLTVTAGASGDATNPTSSFLLVGNPTIIDASHATASFHYHANSPQSGAIVLGDIVAIVPDSAAVLYKAKELLQLDAIAINGGPITGMVSTAGVHVNAYLGDVTANGTIDGLDVATALHLAQGKDTGLPAYPLLDPAIVGDVAADFAVDAGDISALAAFVSRVRAPQIPTPPAGLRITAAGPDPTLSLGSGE